MKQSYLITLVTGIILIFVSPTRADSSGPNSPDSAADQGDWNNPTNVFSSDDSRADHSGTNQHILRAYDFKFSIPAGATINGFYVEIWRKAAIPSREAGKQVICLIPWELKHI
jgi:hypothetical protein